VPVLYQVYLPLKCLHQCVAQRVKMIPPPCMNVHIIGTGSFINISPVSHLLTTSHNSVDTYNAYTYEHTDGPSRYTSYQLTLLFISITCCLIFTPFLPANKAQCHEWRRRGIAEGNSELRGYLCFCAAVVIMVYGFVVAVLLLDSRTSCLPAVGGTGC